MFTSIDPHEMPKVLALYLKIAQYPILARRIRERMRQEIFSRGIISPQVFEEEVKRGFEEAGYGEIPLICELSASVAMAKAVVGMNLAQARVANPRSDTKIKPAYR